MSKIIYLTRRETFSAAHRLHSEELSEEENARFFGKCNNKYGHGHNYTLYVTVRGAVDPKTGVLVNLSDLKRIIRELVTDRFDHRHLNEDVEEFKTLNPTAENIAIVIWELLKPHVDSLYEIKLEETANNVAIYRGESV